MLQVGSDNNECYWCRSGNRTVSFDEELQISFLWAGQSGVSQIITSAVSSVPHDRSSRAGVRAYFLKASIGLNLKWCMSCLMKSKIGHKGVMVLYFKDCSFHGSDSQRVLLVKGHARYLYFLMWYGFVSDYSFHWYCAVGSSGVMVRI